MSFDLSKMKSKEILNVHRGTIPNGEKAIFLLIIDNFVLYKRYIQIPIEKKLHHAKMEWVGFNLRIFWNKICKNKVLMETRALINRVVY